MAKTNLAIIETELLHPLGPSVAGSDTTNLPPVDRALSTRNACAVVLVLGWICGIACLCLGVAIIRGGDRQAIGLDSLAPIYVATEILPLLLSALVTLLTDSLGYIHTTSLRWALWHEGRLHFNSNLRLMTSSKHSAPNKWPANLMWCICLIACYAAVSQILYQTTVPVGPGGYTYGASVNGVAVTALGVGVLGQSIIASWSLLSAKKTVLTWSSNPLDAALACLHEGSTHHPGRAMLGIDQAQVPSGPSTPKLEHTSMRNAYPSTRHVFRSIWALTVLAIIWAGVITALMMQQFRGDQNWGLEPSDTVSFALTTDNNALGHFTALVFIMAIQASMTLGLHLAELLVNLYRDEEIWRMAGPLSSTRQSFSTTGKGAPMGSSSFRMAFTSIPTLILLGFKSITHFFFGRSITIQLATEADVLSAGGAYFDFSPTPTFIFAGCSLTLGIFVTCLAHKSRTGPQPVTWGHLQTLQDLIDDWTIESDGRLWWGDKGDMVIEGYEQGQPLRKAGTSGNSRVLMPVRQDAWYI